MISAKIIQDSINSKTDDRFSTFVVTFPRMVNAEILRHRALSFSSASTRAIPTRKIIKDVLENPAYPVFWGKAQSGMQSFEELDNLDWYGCECYYNGLGDNIEQPVPVTALEKARRTWLYWSKQAIKGAQELIDCNLAKQYAGRILEFCQNITMIISGTEWENFFALRAHKMAQPELRNLAFLMLEKYNQSIPIVKDPYDYDPSDHFWGFNDFASPIFNWHVPFGDKMPAETLYKNQLKIGVARAARISYMNFEGEIDAEKDVALFSKLIESNPPHMSSAEHLAFPIQQSKFVGNVKGWVQLRKLFKNENSKDERIIKRKVVDGKVI